MIGLTVAFTSYFTWTTVWLIEDGPDGELAGSRSKLVFASSAEVTTSLGTVKVSLDPDAARGPHDGEVHIVVNATRDTLVVQERRFGHHGGITFGSLYSRDIPSGEWVRERQVSGVGPAPGTIEMSEKSSVVSLFYVERRR